MSVLISIILGLAIAQVLQGYRAILLSRSRVRLYWPTITWSALLLLFSAQSWWASFDLSSRTDWSFGGFGIVLLQVVFLYMMSGLVLPEIPAGEQIDLREHYYREVAPFFTTSLLMLGSSVTKDWVLDGHLPGPTNLAFHGVFAAFALLALVWRRPRFHEAVAAIMVAFSIAYIAILFSHLQR